MNSKQKNNSYTNNIPIQTSLLDINKSNFENKENSSNNDILLNTPKKRKTNSDNHVKSFAKKTKTVILDMTFCDSVPNENKTDKVSMPMPRTNNKKSEQSKSFTLNNKTKIYLKSIYGKNQESEDICNSPDMFLDDTLGNNNNKEKQIIKNKEHAFKYPKTISRKKQIKNTNNRKSSEFEVNDDFELSQLFKSSQLDKIMYLQPQETITKNESEIPLQSDDFSQLLKSTQINKLLDNTHTMQANSFGQKNYTEINFNSKTTKFSNVSQLISKTCENNKNCDFFESSQLFKAYDLESIIADTEKQNTNTFTKVNKRQENLNHLKDDQECFGPQTLIDLQKTMMETNEINVSIEDTSDKNDLLNGFESSQYKKDISTLFNICEMSICNNSICEDKNMNKVDICNDTIGLAAIEDINWENDSMMTKEFSANENLSKKVSIYDTLKQKLLRNAQNTVEPIKLISNQKQNVKKRKFISKGPFYDLPVKCQHLISQYKNISKLYDWQDECLKLPAIINRKNLIYALPTSGGKTLVAEILILREILCCKKNVIFILPFVSIVQEKIWALSPFAVGLEFLVEEYAGGKGICPPKKRRHKNSVFIATIEKSLGLINSLSEMDRLGEIGLVVVDELHLLGESGRGATLEIVLTKLLNAKEDIHIVGMSATIGNISEVAQFLNAHVYTRDFRPVELKEYVKCNSDIMAVASKTHTVEDMFAFERTCKYNYTDMQRKMDPDFLAGLVLEILPDSSCLIFCPSKKNCENVASLICRIFPKSLLEHRKEDKKRLCEMIKKDCGTLCPILSNTLPFGVAYHHSGLTSDERKHLEDGYRAGVINVICCTSTLAAGVNLPAKRVILRSPYVGKEFITLSRYKQMVGRAGRAGFGESGESILLFTPRDKEKVQNLLFSPMDEALSSLHQYNGEGIKSLILSSIGSNIATTRAELFALISKTLMAVQAERLNIDIKQLTNKTISNLFKLGALTTKEESEKVLETLMENSITFSQSQIENRDTTRSKKCLVVGRNTQLAISKLGKAAAKACINLKRAHMLYNDLLQAQSGLVLQDCLHLLYLVTPYEQCEQIKPNMPIYYSIYTKLGAKELETAKVLGINEACAIKMLSGKQVKNVPTRILNRFYITLMLYDLWNHVAVHDVSDKFHVSRGVVQSLMTSAASFSSSVLRFCEELDEFWAFKDLFGNFTLRLQHCCTLELLPLMELPNVKIARAKQLYNAGYKTLHLIAKTTPACLVRDIENLNKKIASQLISTAKLLLLEKVETLREEAENVLEGLWAT